MPGIKKNLLVIISYPLAMRLTCNFFTNSKASSGTNNMEQWLPITVKGEVLSIFEKAGIPSSASTTSPGVSEDRFRLLSMR